MTDCLCLLGSILRRRWALCAFVIGGKVFVPRSGTTLVVCFSCLVLPPLTLAQISAVSNRTDAQLSTTNAALALANTVQQSINSVQQSVTTTLTNMQATLLQEVRLLVHLLVWTQ